ncbi:MAG: hypothetical protein HKN68_11880 [Saprospiraceae bacterium]|nr:hypothetical protein [Saprospiraceae bacterium]
MIGNLPKNILAYSAVHSDYQGKWFGQELIQPATRYSDGDLALHNKEDNPD